MNKTEELNRKLDEVFDTLESIRSEIKEVEKESDDPKVGDLVIVWDGDNPKDITILTRIAIGYPFPFFSEKNCFEKAIKYPGTPEEAEKIKKLLRNE